MGGNYDTGGGKFNAPAPPDYKGLTQQQSAAQNQLLEQQTRANRPNQSNPYASSTWSQGPDGQWSQSTQYAGPLAGANAALQQQAASTYAKPFSLEGVPGLTSGEDARNQAIQSAYGQAASRLDPQWNQRSDALRTQLLNQGLQEGSEAYNNAMGNLGRERNDAYSSAMANAIGQGTAAGSALFNQSLAGRQQGMQEALTRYNMPLQQMQAMNALTGQAGFSQAGLGQAPNYLGAGGMQDAANYRNWQAHQQALSDLYGAGSQLLGQAGSFLPFML